MNLCPICGRVLDAESEFYVEDILCCSYCEKQYDVIMNSEKPFEVKKAINYFYTHLKNVNEVVLRDFLMELIECNAEIVEEKGEVQKSVTADQDYFEMIKTQEEFYWIHCAEKIAWGCFILLLIVDLVVVCSLFRMGIFYALLVGAGIFALAFTGLASVMVFLGMAEDVKHIKHKLKK